MIADYAPLLLVCFAVNRKGFDAITHGFEPGSRTMSNCHVADVVRSDCGGHFPAVDAGIRTA
jgi:hypothetical protein